ncbi:MAG TPA: PTS sugar transporter subunit IIC [Gemmatimonadales bacterium]|nr:PTS sugar transporter subunit IIC [Gemmatimonadales bacterium]
MTAPLVLAALLAWGTLVGLDLVSVAQAMIARPFVAGSVAGLLLGDPAAGLRVGVLLELFALDVLPVGAARYPDYGPATVAATAVAVGSPWELSLGLAGTVGLLVSVLGGWSLQRLRRLNAAAVQRHAAALAAGESAAIRRLQYGGIVRDALRSALLTALGLAAAWVADRWLLLDRRTAVALTLVVVGAALAAALGGALRSAGRSRRRRWLAAGLVLGIALAVAVLR